MTAVAIDVRDLSMDLRELSFDEIDMVNGGDDRDTAILAIAVGVGTVASVAAAPLVAAFAAGFAIGYGVGMLTR